MFVKLADDRKIVVQKYFASYWVDQLVFTLLKNVSHKNGDFDIY